MLILTGFKNRLCHGPPGERSAHRHGKPANEYKFKQPPSVDKTTITSMMIVTCQLKCSTYNLTTARRNFYTRDLAYNYCSLSMRNALLHTFFIRETIMYGLLPGHTYVYKSYPPSRCSVEIHLLEWIIQLSSALSVRLCAPNFSLLVYVAKWMSDSNFTGTRLTDCSNE